MTRVFAPWTQEQAAALVRWQKSNYVHPFTCPNRGDGNHSTTVHSREGGDLGELVPTKDGWFCPSCDYRQDWAHDFMFDDPRAPTRTVIP